MSMYKYKKQKKKENDAFMKYVLLIREEPYNMEDLLSDIRYAWVLGNLYLSGYKIMRIEDINLFENNDIKVIYTRHKIYPQINQYNIQWTPSDSRHRKSFNISD